MKAPATASKPAVREPQPSGAAAVDAQPPLLKPAAADVRRPAWATGQGGWDAHAHVFGREDRFPYRPDRMYTPPEQTAAQYLAMLDAIGVRFGVLVQPSVYGTDNACLLHALTEYPGRLLGVVDLDVLAIEDAAMEALTRCGVRGLRVRWPGRHSLDTLSEVARRLRAFGWHLDVLPSNTSSLPELAPYLDGWNLGIMIEAMGNPRPGETPASPGFQALLGLARRNRNIWIKLSHAYHIDPAGLPYSGSAPFARALVEAVPEQLVWGSDWPHPMPEGQMPNDGDLIDLLPQWAGSQEQARRILIDNPLRFYGTSTLVLG